jgi:hypothetical protein
MVDADSPIQIPSGGSGILHKNNENEAKVKHAICICDDCIPLKN